MSDDDDKKTGGFFEVLPAVTIYHPDGCGHTEKSSSGKPAAVTSPEYRVNHERIFGKKPVVGQA